MLFRSRFCIFLPLCPDQWRGPARGGLGVRCGARHFGADAAFRRKLRQDVDIRIDEWDSRRLVCLHRRSEQLKSDNPCVVELSSHAAERHDGPVEQSAAQLRPGWNRGDVHRESGESALGDRFFLHDQHECHPDGEWPCSSHVYRSQRHRRRNGGWRISARI